MHTKHFIITCLLFCSCAQNTTQKDNDLTQNPITDSTTIQKEQHAEININFSNIEEFTGEDGLYKFNAPKGLFVKGPNNEFISEVLNAKIIFSSDMTNQFDETGIFSKKDLINQCKSKISCTYSVDKNDWFVLSGFDKKNNMVYLKGFYDELVSMEGREEGEPSWLWSKSAILEIQYSEKFRKEFDKLIPIIMNSFKCDFSIM